MPKGHPHPCPKTLDLLAGWTPPDPAIRYEADDVRGTDLSTKIARAIATSLKESGLAREEVAKRMGEYLGETVPVSALNQYSALSKPHEISHKRLIALSYALSDWRLLSIAAEELDCIVVPASYGELIQVALTAEKVRELNERLETSRGLLKNMGLL